MQQMPWPDVPVNLEAFREPPREYGILPFWFLNGELDPDEMCLQLKEFRDKGMPGIILHGRFGLETPYLGCTYLDRMELAVAEAEKLGLKTWIYDEMNWPSGTADKRVLEERPDLAQRYLECLSFPVRGPWFSYLTGEDSRYIDFERSTPVAAFALGSDRSPRGDRSPRRGRQLLDLTPNLSFGDVIPWEAPPGHWQLMYIVEKRADYYIDALDPEATTEFLRLGYEPYAKVVGDSFGSQVPGFYTDEPAMHYYVTGGDNPIVPWTKDMFRRFHERNGYNLRPRLPDLFFDVSPDSARVRYDYYTTLTEFYTDAYYKQIHKWCQRRGVLFTGHLLYEEWLRRMIRVEGNPFKHYAHLDVVGVDHLYPFIGNRDRPDEHVALKLASSAAHHLGSDRLLCESFGGIFMDATMQRMKWIADWQYVLGVNLLNPHGFHYTLEGPRKRDWPPSMFYQYPWWHYYGEFSKYISRTSHMLTGGRHVAKVAVLWPINAMFGTYIPQTRTPLNERTETDFNVLTDLLLRLHYDFDYLDEDILAGAEIAAGKIRMRDEEFELLILPPMVHIKLRTVERLEEFIQAGGRVLGLVFLPDQAYGPDGLVDISERMSALFNVHPRQLYADYRGITGIETFENEVRGGGRASLLRTYALNRQLPMRLQLVLDTPGRTESPYFVIDAEGDASRYWFALPGAERQNITNEVKAERQEVSEALDGMLSALCAPDVAIDNPEVFYLHRHKDGRDVYFLVNPTFTAQDATVTLPADVQPLLWDPSTGEERPITPAALDARGTSFSLTLPPVGSAFVLTTPEPVVRVIDTNIVVDSVRDGVIRGYARSTEGYVLVQRDGEQNRFSLEAGNLLGPMTLEGEWEFLTEDANALVLGNWLARQEELHTPLETYVAPDAADQEWQPMVPGAWSYQLPVEPSEPYPVNVWYRIEFETEYLPPKLDLVIDGFAGEERQLYLNGQSVDSLPVRSSFDSQMQAVELTGLAQKGRNVLAVRLTLRNTTDGILDLIKLMGDFSLAPDSAVGWKIVEPRRVVQPSEWTDQGYPFFSGRAVYRREFELRGSNERRRVFLEPPMTDDVLEVVVNGRAAGVRLWAPYETEVTELLQPGRNTLELRVANTLVNLLEAVQRPSGLAGAPRLVAYNEFKFQL